MEQRETLLCHTLVQWMKCENIYRVIPLCSDGAGRTFIVSYPCIAVEQRDLYRVIPLYSEWSEKTFIVSYPRDVNEVWEPLPCHTLVNWWNSDNLYSAIPKHQWKNILFYDLFRNESERVIFLLYFFLPLMIIRNNTLECSTKTLIRLLSRCCHKLFTFSSSSPEPLDQFQPNLAQASLGEENSSLFK